MSRVAGRRPRERVLAALSGALAGSDWQSVGIKELAGRSGVSRQTVYNLFGTRAGLARALVGQLLDQLIEPLGEGPLEDPRDAEAALSAGFGAFFAALAADRIPLRGLADDAELVDQASRRLAAEYRRRVPGATDEEMAVLARAVTRVCVSYLGNPPVDDPSHELARVFAPYVESAVTRSRCR
jgi:AcrR family transcriptional regulator